MSPNSTNGVKWKPTLSTNSYPQEPEPLKPLNIAIVGAGIGGLSAAIGLRRQGHDVSVSLRLLISDNMKANKNRSMKLLSSQKRQEQLFTLRQTQMVYFDDLELSQKILVLSIWTS